MFLKNRILFKAQEVVSIDDFKKVVKSSNNTPIQVGSMIFQIIPCEEQNLDNLENVEIDKILKDQEDAAAKQKLLYEFLQNILRDIWNLNRLREDDLQSR